VRFAYKLRMRLNVLLLSVSVVACSSDSSSSSGSTPSSPAIGIWKGTVNGVTVTAEITTAYDNAGTSSIQGILSTTKTECFKNATAAGSLVKSSIDIGGVGAGTVSTQTVAKITGDLVDGKITGQFEMVASEQACNFKGPITLTK
jgi:hypothetical protein